MAVEHGRAARALGWSPTLLARSGDKARKTAEESGLQVEFGDVQTWLEMQSPQDHAVVAVSVDALAPVTMALIAGGVGKILVEKPGGVGAAELARLDAAAEASGAEVYIAYNRRFFASVRAARTRLLEAGGATSLRFDFTELAWKVATLKTPAAVKAAWLYANSTHVIDTAFFLTSEPERLRTEIAGGLSWHPVASRFSGSGRTDQGCLFSYVADWESPGRWSVDVRSHKERLLLEPMESLQVQAAGGFSWESVPLDNLDGGLKPGILAQMRAFLDGHGGEHLMPLALQARRAAAVYDRILTTS